MISGLTNFAYETKQGLTGPGVVFNLPLPSDAALHLAHVALYWTDLPAASSPYYRIMAQLQFLKGQEVVTEYPCDTYFIPAWNLSRTWPAGVVVRFEGALYEAVQEAVGTAQDPSHAAYWKPHPLLYRNALLGSPVTLGASGHANLAGFFHKLYTTSGLGHRRIRYDSNRFTNGRHIYGSADQVKLQVTEVSGLNTYEAGLVVQSTSMEEIS